MVLVRLVLLLVLTGGFAAKATIKSGGLMIISDVDDTIKLTHMLDLSDVALYGLRTDSYFLGMNQVYQACLRTKRAFY